MTIWELSLRITIAFVTLLLLTRIMGRKEVSQMTFFNFVSGIAIGTIGGSLVVNSTLSIRNGILALVGWAAFTVVMGIIDIKSKKARQFIEGQPRILIKNGQVMEREMQKVRLDIDALNALLRKKNVFAISDVEYAIFETDGKLSVMKKEPKQSVTKNDMDVQTKASIFPMPTEVISDGTINSTNLDKLGLTKEWLNKQLNIAGVQSVSDVFYAEVQKDGSLYIDNKEDLLH